VIYSAVAAVLLQQQQQEITVSSMTANPRCVLLIGVLFLVQTSSAQLLTDGLAEKLASLEGQQQQQQGPKAVDQLLLAHTEAAAPAPASSSGAEHVHDYELHGMAQQHGQSRGSYDKECPSGCERNGNCNRALGR
jgi:hypothetical protein